MKIFVRIGLIILCNLLLNVDISAQDFQCKTYTTKEGLSSNGVNDVIQDNQGFVWVATGNGLNRFDGNIFDVYFHNPNDSNSLCSNQLHSLYRDSKDRLWISSIEGLSLYNPAANNFQNYAPDTSIFPISGASLGALKEDNSGNIWVGSSNDLLIFNTQNKQFFNSGWGAYAANLASLKGNRLRVAILDIAPKSNQEFWVLSTYGLFSVNTATLKFQFYPYKKENDYHGSLLKYASKAGEVWITTYDKGFLRYQESTNQWKEYQTPRKFSSWDNAFNLVPFKGDTMMYLSANSLLFFNAKTESIIESGSCKPLILGDEKGLRCTYIKKAVNSLWICTNNGLLQLMPKQTIFETHALPTLVEPNRIFCTSLTKKRFVGSTEGVYLLNENGSTVPILDSEHKKIKSTYLSVLETKKGNIYFNSDKRVYRFNPITNSATPLPIPPKRNPLNFVEVRNQVEDNNGMIWIRTVGQGILQYNPFTNQTTYAPNLPTGKNRSLRCLYFDSLSNTLWFSEEFYGVYVYNVITKHLEHYRLNAPPSQKSATVYYITGNGKGKVWLTNVPNGFTEFDYLHHKITHFTVMDGLLSNNLISICLDEVGGLWMSTHEGLSVMNTVTKKFTHFLSSKGYPECLEGFISIDNQGNLYLPRPHGFYKWNPTLATQLNQKGILYIRKVQLFNQILPIQQAYHFNYTQNSIQFLFGYRSFSNKAPKLIEYKLNNQPWITTELNSEISFANLASGKYQLQIHDKNNPNNWLLVHFVIATPFWLSWWFIVLFTLLLGSIIFLAVKQRIKTIKTQSALKLQMQFSEMQALRSQMNPHFIFNTLNSINSYIIENKTAAASDYLIEFSRLMRIVLDHSRKELITLEEELLALKGYISLEFKRLEGGFDYVIDIDETIDFTQIKIPPLVIQPFVENAIWHGLRPKKGEGFIRIKFEKRVDGILITIEDNGVGRKIKDKMNTSLNASASFGGTATIKRIKLAYKHSEVEIIDLLNEDETPSGTKVLIFFNINQHTK